MSAGADQTLLLRAGFVAENGLYGIGVRIVNYAMLPVGAVMATTYPEFFAKGTEGIEATIAFAKKVARPMLAYGVGILIPLWVGAVVLEWIMGEKYDGLAVVICAMSGFPLLRIMQVLIGDSLKGVGHFGEASIAILLTALLNVGLNLVLIPDYSWKGAAAATYIAEIVYLLLLLVALRRVRRTSRRLDPISTHRHGSRLTRGSYRRGNARAHPTRSPRAGRHRRPRAVARPARPRLSHRSTAGVERPRDPGHELRHLLPDPVATGAPRTGGG